MNGEALTRGFKFFCMRLLCVMGLHEWVPQLWDVESEAMFYRRNGRLPTLYAYCWYCTKRKEIRS